MFAVEFHLAILLALAATLLLSIVSHCFFRKLDYDDLMRNSPRLNDDAIGWWMMHEILRSINGGRVLKGLLKAVSCAVQAIVQWNLGSSTDEESYWKAACMLVVTYKGKTWVADQLLAAYSKIPDTGFHVTEGRQYLYILPMAANCGNKSVVEKTLKDGVNVNLSDKYLGNALHAAAHGGNTDMIQLLLDNGADVNSECGNSPLHVAVIRGHEEAVRLLLKQQDIDVNFKNSQNKTPLSVAVENGHTGVVRLLLERSDIQPSIRCHVPWYGDEPPLYYAARGTSSDGGDTPGIS